MRRVLSIIPGLVLVLGMSAQAVAAPPPATLYLALGDSLAVGDGASDWDTTAYVPLMADYFAGTPHGGAKHMLNLAIGGETTDTFIANGQLTNAVTAILDPATDTKVVTLSLGGNDLLDLLNEPTDVCVQAPTSYDCQLLVAQQLGELGANYPTIVGTLQWALATEDADVEPLFVLTVYNPFGGLGEPYELPIDGALLGADMRVDCSALGNPYNIGMDDLITCVSGALGASVVDGYAAIDDNALALTHIGDPGFNIHPNDLGYEAIAKAHRLVERSL